MILNVICDECGEAVATRVVYETKWAQRAFCGPCYEEVDLETIYDWKYLYANLETGLLNLVAHNPGITTKELVDHVSDWCVIPVFLPPWDSQVKEVLRNRECFRATKIEGSNALSYEVVDEVA